MLKLKNILLASHGTDGARAAEKMAYTLCQPGTTLHHLIVVPDFWKGTIGDDWLNNASTRDTFGKYLESQLEQELRAHIKRVSREAARRKIAYRYKMMQGKPTDCLARRSKNGKIDLVVMGSTRPKGETGLRSRMLIEKMFRMLNVPVLIAPYPS